MTPMKLLVRLADRLQNAWFERANHDHAKVLGAVSGLDRRYYGVREADHTLRKAVNSNLTLLFPRYRELLAIRLQSLRDAVVHATCELKNDPPTPPKLNDLIADLRQLDEEFGQLHIDWDANYLAVHTEPIALNEVYLGPFALRLYWKRLEEFTDSSCFDVVALDPNPAEDNELVTHPHVRDEALCPGDAKAALDLALKQGRLADAFQLVRSVLLHYNPQSAHVRLEVWGGSRCHDCGHTVDEDDSFFCNGCSEDYCDNCSGSCAACGEARCLGCLSRCSGCEEPFCPRCLEILHSDKICCRECRTNCQGCGALVTRADVKSGHCPACSPVQGQAAGPLGETSTAFNPENLNDSTLEPVASISG